WWHRLMTDTGSNLVLNCSFSGTTICNTGYNGADCKNISFIARMDKLIDSGYFTENSIDTVFIFGGTNDNWAGSPVGELKFENFEIKDLYSVLPAFCYLLIRIKANIQNARVINIINTDLKQEIRENMKIACEKYGVEVIELQDFDRLNGHPSVLGMSQIEKQVLDYLNNAK
ncbi:MAG: SGNH/GDSL hydrolase family protein, partial [Acutalibacteraceae bacterium]